MSSGLRLSPGISVAKLRPDSGRVEACVRNWLVLYVRTGSEKRVSDLLQKRLDTSRYTPFIPTKVWPRVKNGKAEGKTVACFPGYVFISAAGGADETARDVFPIAVLIKEAYFFLHYGENKRDAFMRPDERSQLEHFLNSAFCMEASVGFMEGDRVRIVSGALTGMESRIKRINRRKCTAVVEIPMMGAPREITLMLEIVEKIGGGL
jgi:transcriptional antiterminator NusG